MHAISFPFAWPADPIACLWRARTGEHRASPGIVQKNLRVRGEARCSLSLNSSMKFGTMADTDYSITIKSESMNSQSAVFASGTTMKSSSGDVIASDGGGR